MRVDNISKKKKNIYYSQPSIPISIRETLKPDLNLSLHLHSDLESTKNVHKNRVTQKMKVATQRTTIEAKRSRTKMIIIKSRNIS